MPNQIITLRHPLFDSASDYCQARDGGRAYLRMRGYFHMLWGFAEQENLPIPQRSLRSEDTRRALGNALGGVEVLDALALQARVLFVEATESTCVSEAQAELCLVREANHSITATLLVRDPKHLLAKGNGALHSCHCRAFLFEPGHIARIEEDLLGRPFIEAFNAHNVAENDNVRRVLVACSPLEAHWDGNGDIRFARLEISARYALLPPRREMPTLVVVLHPL